VQQQDGLRIYGAGIASSASETLFALDDASPNRVRFDLPRVMRTHYRIDDFQQTYFVLDSFDDLLHLADIDFADLYSEVQRLPELEPDDTTPEDLILHRGTGAYHAKRVDESPRIETEANKAGADVARVGTSH
jgi:phenylalanine-4-hydroxylase